MKRKNVAEKPKEEGDSNKQKNEKEVSRYYKIPMKYYNNYFIYNRQPVKETHVQRNLQNREPHA